MHSFAVLCLFLVWYYQGLVDSQNVSCTIYPHLPWLLYIHICPSAGEVTLNDRGKVKPKHNKTHQNASYENLKIVVRESKKWTCPNLGNYVLFQWGIIAVFEVKWSFVPMYVWSKTFPPWKSMTCRVSWVGVPNWKKMYVTIRNIICN